jgi:hypothetical protein
VEKYRYNTRQGVLSSVWMVDGCSLPGFNVVATELEIEWNHLVGLYHVLLRTGIAVVGMGCFSLFRGLALVCSKCTKISKATRTSDGDG